MDITNLDKDKTKLQNVKQRFFALRNGLLADQLRKAGSPYSIIFGLNLPQLREIAAVFGTDSELAETLWQNKTTRESRLLAPMLADKALFTMADVDRWISSLNGSVEEADILCHSLLRHLPEAGEIIKELVNSTVAINRYVGLRVALSKINSDPIATRCLAQRELGQNEELTRRLALQIIDEADFLTESEDRSGV